MLSGDGSAAGPNQGTEPAPSPDRWSPDETQAAREVLITEYNVLMAALNAAWSASLTRTSLFLGVLSAAGVAFGFASQGGMGSSAFVALALVVLLLVLFLGVATFIRLVVGSRSLCRRGCAVGRGDDNIVLPLDSRYFVRFLDIAFL